MAGPRDLTPEQAAAVALARLVEILPFDDANGRVSRLAASHLMVRGGMRPPILVAGDAARLRAALEAAFRLETEPLVALLAEASGRALDVMIQTLSATLIRSPCGGAGAGHDLPLAGREVDADHAARRRRGRSARSRSPRPAGTADDTPQNPIAGRRPESRSTTRPLADVHDQGVLGEERAPEGRHGDAPGSDLGPDAEPAGPEVEAHLAERRPVAVEDPDERAWSDPVPSGAGPAPDHDRVRRRGRGPSSGPRPRRGSRAARRWRRPAGGGRRPR